MTTTDFDVSLKIILDSLPEEHDGPQRRKHALTKKDAELMADMIRLAVINQGCSIGLSPEQMGAIKGIPAETFGEIKEMVRERRRLLNALGALTLAILAFVGKWIFEKVEWSKVWLFMSGK